MGKKALLVYTVWLVLRQSVSVETLDHRLLFFSFPVDMFSLCQTMNISNHSQNDTCLAWMDGKMGEKRKTREKNGGRNPWRENVIQRESGNEKKAFFPALHSYPLTTA